jgi:hypothetical protein
MAALSHHFSALGIPYLFIKIAVHELDLAVVVFACAGIAVVVLLLITVRSAPLGTAVTLPTDLA